MAFTSESEIVLLRPSAAWPENCPLAVTSREPLVIVQGQPDLLEVVLARGTAGRLPSGLHGRQQQDNQHGDNRNHHQRKSVHLYGRSMPRSASEATISASYSLRLKLLMIDLTIFA